MKSSVIHGLICFILLTFHASASVFYVNINNPAPAAPFTTWDTAATNIQDAIDASTNGDQILVTNGIYNTGGRVMAGDLTNRIALNKAVTVQSINGPLKTSIIGIGATNGPIAIRCAWLTNGASLIGFTLARGATRTAGDPNSLLSGGGVWCASSNALIGSCIIVSNTANQYGGGVYQGTITSSLVSSNGASFVGGASYKSVLINCTIVSNAVAGVVSPWAMTNCIIYFNNTPGNFYSATGNTFSHCCTTPTLSGTANFTNAPQLFADGIQLTSNSPCIGTGVDVNGGADLFGNAWSNPPSVGCEEWTFMPLVSAPQIKLTGDPVGFSIGNLAVGSTSPCNFNWLKDGVVLQDDGHFNATQTTNLVVTGVRFSDTGNYQVIVSNAVGVVTSSVVKLTVHCVDAASINPIVPYSTWATAATNIQDAIAASTIGDVVLVTNGLYASGGKSMDGVITNRVSLDKAILVQSVNGASATIIQGAWDPTSTNGPGAVRCAWMTNNAILSGFTFQNGATRAEASTTAAAGGGIWGSLTNALPSPTVSAIVANCLIINNTAANMGGGAYHVILNYCTIATNLVSGNNGSGGGAEGCNLNNCSITYNIAGGNGGGVDSCNLRNCFLKQNSAYNNGAGAYGGTMVSCTIAGNLSILSSGYYFAVYGTKVTNSIIFGNYSGNYGNCTMTYCCSDPLPAGTGNFDLDPQIIADGYHLAATSPCRGVGISNVISGFDIDGQSWNNPPSIGCDEWQPSPVIGIQPYVQIGLPAHGLTFTVGTAGQIPVTYFWSKDGISIQDDERHNNSTTASLILNNLRPEDAGLYQVVVSNAYGVVTSAVVQVVIHAVNAAGLTPNTPYSTWADAATNIQDAIDIAAVGDIVLVTNGIYATGGKIVAGDLTNRVAINKAITVISVNGYATTVIQGAWDPLATNGPAAVRCAYLADGAILNGFTLQNGATRATGDAYTGGALESGGGIWCNSFNGIAVDCVLSNNSAIYGGGIAYGMLNNSLVLNNSALYGGGACFATLNNCTVVNNVVPQTTHGGGTCGGLTRNSIVINNYDNQSYLSSTTGNHTTVMGGGQYDYSCTYPTSGLSGTGNINANPQFLDLFHLADTSPCHATGSALYSDGSDLDGEALASPPSMGCDEIITSNLVGPLSANIYSYQTNVLINRPAWFSGTFTGRATGTQWLLNDGTIATNTGSSFSYIWTNAGDYTITFTVFNNDNPDGISANTIIHVQSLNIPQIQSVKLLTNTFQFQFTGQTNVNYTVQYATNLISPVIWQTLQTIYYSNGGTIQINDSALTNMSRFYRVLAQ